MAKDLWVEKYRPTNVGEYVFRDEAQRKQVQNWIDDGGIPHLLFSGSPGTGKTTLAKVLIEELSVEESNKVFQAFEDGVLENTQMKTEEYFRKLWSDVNKVGFEKDDSNHCIDTCNTLIKRKLNGGKREPNL